MVNMKDVVVGTLLRCVIGCHTCFEEGDEAVVTISEEGLIVVCNAPGDPVPHRVESLARHFELAEGPW